MITVCFITNRIDCKIQWFFESFWKQVQPYLTKGSDGYSVLKESGFKVVVVDHWAESYGDWTPELVAQRKYEFAKICPFTFTHIAPKPTVWGGKHRLTTQNYFSASNSRNTGLCHAEDGFIAYVDDLSVLMPGWLEQVVLAQSKGYVALGHYRKVKSLFIENGEVVKFEDHPSGHDSRRKNFTSDEPFKCAGSWMFGCSVALPVEAVLTVNGWDENLDSGGGEDYSMGMCLNNAGFDTYMCPKMLTWESEEHHHIEKPFKRIIKPYPGMKDSSWASLAWYQGGKKYCENYQNMRETRDAVLRGEPFPIIQIPQHDWRDSQPLSEM